MKLVEERFIFIEKIIILDKLLELLFINLFFDLIGVCLILIIFVVIFVVFIGIVFIGVKWKYLE